MALLGEVFETGSAARASRIKQDARRGESSAMIVNVICKIAALHYIGELYALGKTDTRIMNDKTIIITPAFVI